MSGAKQMPFCGVVTKATLIGVLHSATAYHGHVTFAERFALRREDRDHRIHGNAFGDTEARVRGTLKAATKEAFGHTAGKRPRSICRDSGGWITALQFLTITQEHTLARPSGSAYAECSLRSKLLRCIS